MQLENKVIVDAEEEVDEDVRAISLDEEETRPVDSPRIVITIAAVSEPTRRETVEQGTADLLDVWLVLGAIAAKEFKESQITPTVLHWLVVTVSLSSSHSRRSRRKDAVHSDGNVIEIS